MEKALAPFAPYACAIMRIILVCCLSRRAKALWPWFGGQPVPLAALFDLAAIIEIVLGLLITIGFLASYAAFIGEMVKRMHPPSGPAREAAQFAARCNWRYVTALITFHEQASLPSEPARQLPAAFHRSIGNVLFRNCDQDREHFDAHGSEQLGD